MINEKILNHTEARKILGVSENTFRKFLPEIPHVKRGRKIYILYSNLVKFASPAPASDPDPSWRRKLEKAGLKNDI